MLDGQSAAPATAAKDRHVILISLDGFPAVALDNPRTPVPTLHRLVREGARAAAVVPVNPVVTWPNHTTYVTGVTPATHQVMFNGLLMRDASGLPKSSRGVRSARW